MLVSSDFVGSSVTHLCDTVIPPDSSGTDAVTVILLHISQAQANQTIKMMQASGSLERLGAEQ